MEKPSKPHYEDMPEQRLFSVMLEYAGIKKNTVLDIGKCAIALFRHRPDMDYLAILPETADGNWIFIFDKHPLIYWMGDLALTREGKRMLRLMERNNGKFRDRYGWNPDVVIEDYPSQNELDVYVEYEMNRDLHADLNSALKEDFDDGA